MTHNSNLAIVERFVGAALAGDGETLKALCDPEFKLHEGSGLSYAGTYSGGDGFMQLLGILNETFKISRLEPTRTYVSDDPDYVVCELELEATVRTTGRTFASSLLERWHFRDTKVLEIKAHYFNAM